MPPKTAYERKSKYRAKEYRGERGVGGNIVYAGNHLLDKHLFVHRVAPGGFDWGPEADEDRVCQLAIALLAPIKGVDEAVANYHIFAGNVVKRELEGDSWTIKLQDLRNPAHLKQYMDREYPENTVPSPDDVPSLEDVDFDSITYAEEIALAEKYEAVLWTRGNRRENLRRLRGIWTGSIDPAEDRVQRSHLYHMIGNASSNARQVMAAEFETMGDLAGWVYYGRNHARMTGISKAAARHIRDARCEFVQYFGGVEYIPAFDDGYHSLDPSTDTDDQQQSLETVTDRISHRGR
jgi:hypothetical protein